VTIQLGQIAPDFAQDSSAGRIRFHYWLGDSWGVLFSHAQDDAGAIELAEVASLKPEWDKRNVKPIGISTDQASGRTDLVRDIDATQGQTLNVPMIADRDHKVSSLYGTTHLDADPSITVRTVVIVDPNKKVRLILTYPPSTRRNFSEVLRVIDSLQLTDAHKTATPANWTDGPPVIVVPDMTESRRPSVLLDYFDKTLKSPRLRRILDQAKTDAGRA
jgi:alkyl hydroperoxide reductase subunit AhpC